MTPTPEVEKVGYHRAITLYARTRAHTLFHVHLHFFHFIQMTPEEARYA